MATKKADKAQADAVEATTRGAGSREKQLEDRRQRRLEAETVDGTESFPPPGMDLPDGGQVPLDEGEHGEDVTGTAKQAQRVQDKKA